MGVAQFANESLYKHAPSSRQPSPLQMYILPVYGMNNIPSNISANNRERYLYALQHLHSVGIPPHIGKNYAKSIMRKNPHTAHEVMKIKEAFPKLTYNDAFFLQNSKNRIQRVPSTNISNFINTYMNQKKKVANKQTALNSALKDPRLLKKQAANTIRKGWKWTYKLRTLPGNRTINNPKWKAKVTRNMEAANRNWIAYITRTKLGLKKPNTRPHLMAEIRARTKKIN